MSNEVNTTNNNNNNNQQVISSEPSDEITKQIRAEQDKELSYTSESSKAGDERVKYLAKKDTYKIMMDNGAVKTVKRMPLSAKRNKEIEDLRSGFMVYKDIDENNPVKLHDKEFISRSDMLFDAYRKCGNYSLGLTDDEYDSAIWEDFDEYIEQDIWGTRSIIEACLLRAVHGIAHFRQPSKTS